MQLLFVGLAISFTSTSLHRQSRNLSPSRSNHRSIAMDAFKRAEVLFGGETVTEREVVNVIGRWKETSQWNDIGAAVQLDKMVAAGVRSKSQGTFSDRPTQVVDQQRTPERRKMLQKMGQVQRFLFVENVPTLPFKDAALARSVGASVRELNSEPLNPLALEVVFDALTQSKSSFANQTAANARRAKYQNKDGSFNAAALTSDLAAGRLYIYSFAAAFYGTQNLLVLAVLYKRGNLDGLLDGLSHLGDVFSSPLLFAGLTAPLIGRTETDLLVPNLVGLGAYVGLFALLFYIFRPQILEGKDLQSSPLEKTILNRKKD